MHSISVVILLAGFTVLGSIPIMVLVAWLVRRGNADGEARPMRAVGIALVVVMAAALAGGWFILSAARQPGAMATGSGDMEGMPGMLPAAPSADATAAPTLPSEVAGMSLTSGVTGAEALQEVSRLHGKDVPLVAAAIGRYTAGVNRAEVWIARTTLPSGATAMAQKMADRITEGRSPFERPELLAGTEGVWITRGMGQVHYFFARGAAVWWLSVDEPASRQALEQVLAAAGS